MAQKCQRITQNEQGKQKKICQKKEGINGSWDLTIQKRYKSDYDCQIYTVLLRNKGEAELFQCFY